MAHIEPFYNEPLCVLIIPHNSLMSSNTNLLSVSFIISSFVAQFHHYSSYNSFLLALQMCTSPDSFCHHLTISSRPSNTLAHLQIIFTYLLHAFVQMWGDWWLG